MDTLGFNTEMASYDWQGNEQRESFRQADDIMQMLERNFGLGISDNDMLKQKVQQLLDAADSTA
jgi:hypothetical protein